ncbi:MAG TPA: response regulator [Solirubrobacteraceae bacterium]|nr:response regulator [Solirubrobacteraceae bacterium]
MSDPDSAPTILVADDEEDLRELVAYRLSRSGYNVIGAEDGQEALELAAERTPDLMVLDVMMPKLDGYELTRRVRAEAALRSIPVILLTARSQESDIDRGFEVGADDYLKKPFNPDELVARVRAVLGRR